MSAPIADLSSLTPPSDDGAIQRALGELESKLCAWSDAMTKAQHTLADQLRRYADSPAEPATPAEVNADIEPVPETAATTAPLDTTETTETISEPTSAPDHDELVNRLSEAMRHSEHLEREIGGDDGTENAAETTEPPCASESTDDEMEELLATIDTEVAEQLRARHAEAGGAMSMREICDAYFAEVTETEKLLSELEPDVAKAIRVQYRLFNGRKSIRQLVDEYEPPKESSRKRRSWWRG